MKYMTKEWYETMQKTDFYLLLKVSKKADVFSEEYFRELYKRKEKKWLKLQKEVSEVSFEDIYPEEFYAEYADGSPLEESDFEEAKKAYFEQREQARINFDNLPSFDSEQGKKNFKKSYFNNLKYLKNNLPEPILLKVADIRVLALDYASREVKQEITQFCKQNEKSIHEAMAAYQKQYREQFKIDAPAFAEKLSLHDCEVLSCRKTRNDVVMVLDNSESFTRICKIKMKNCDVIKQDAPLHGAWCLYEEIYKSGEKYEIHFLMQKNKLIDYIIAADDLEYQYDL